MQLTIEYGKTNGKIAAVTAQNYRLIFPIDRPYVYLESPHGQRIADLFVLSSVHPLHGRDDTLRIGDWVTVEAGDTIQLSLEASSGIWRKKTYRLICSPLRFKYEIEVEGSGQLSEVNYFGGYYSGHLRWGSGFFWSGQHFKRGFNPEPNTDEINYFMPREGSRIEMTGVPLPGMGGWFFTPPPFCFAFDTGSSWMGVGIEAPCGQNNFTEYAYHGQSSGFYLSLAYEGHTNISGRTVLPGVGFDFDLNEYCAISAHSNALRELGYAPTVKPGPKPAWWYEPIFCGWGQQCYLADLDGGRGPDYSRQELYEDFVRELAAHNVSPGIIVLDDKWQATYGENCADEQKWPDLPGFIRKRHAAGQKVLLWLKAWDPEGVPASECITNACGMALAVDPSNPAYEKRLRNSVRRMLSADGYDADGFKIDFTARIPSGPGISTYGDVWGLELMKLYLGIIYQEAKLAKPDALVMTHSPNPYLADVLDMIRLNDINKDKNVNRAMRLRAKVAMAACPEAIIDTDNWPITDRETWRRYLRLQPTLGVPSLYYVTHIDSTKEPLEEEDYQLIRKVWDRHRARCKVHPRRRREVEK